MNKNKVMKKKKKGFTLIELIAVVAILAILAAVAVPRVIKYVDKSKRVAVQTEASTIYNAAEAAYNDGKLGQTTSGTGGKNNFDDIKVSDAVNTLKGEDLLSNADTSKLGTAKDGNLAGLKEIISANEADIQVNNKGVYTGIDNSNTGK
ncbi:prepilin-type N-terminal cleavage/methylation domain-containing protein [Clostridium baratii]|uniref:prepilin-type N-terminal cleavage/methylation domain-containing protein n=1 Tax=Clostridium baratii TaxID=1561 RepID=UPI003D3263CA